MDQSITFLPESPPTGSGLVPKHLNDGLSQVKFKGSKLLGDKEDTTSIQLSLSHQKKLGQTDLLSCMPEFQAALKRTILNNKYSFSSLVIQTQKSSKTSGADSTLKEKVFKPYWTELSAVLASMLSLPTKIGFVALGSILSHGCVLNSKPQYWFSTKRTSAQNKKWLKMYSRSSMSSVVDCMDSGNIKTKSLKTTTYRVYPNKDLEKIWKKWVAAVRKVYNISIEQLNKNQGYTKVGKKGGKHGFRTWVLTIWVNP